MWCNSIQVLKNWVDKVIQFLDSCIYDFLDLMKICIWSSFSYIYPSKSSTNFFGTSFLLYNWFKQQNRPFLDTLYQPMYIRSSLSFVGHSFFHLIFPQIRLVRNQVFIFHPRCETMKLGFGTLFYELVI